MISILNQLQGFSLLCQRLATMHNKGFSLMKASELLASESKTAQEKKQLAAFIKALENGDTLGTALAVFLPKTLYHFQSNYPVPDTGLFLSNLSQYYSTQHRLINAWLQGLRYPLVLGSAAIGILILFMSVLIPIYASLLDNMGGMPPFLKAIMALRQFLILHGGFMGFGLLLLMLMILKKHRFNIQTFLLSRLFPAHQSSIFGHLGILLLGGYSLKLSLEIATPPKHTALYRPYVACSAKVLSGQAFSDTFSQHFLLSAYQAAILTAGEQQADLAAACLDVSSQLQQQFFEKRQRIMAWTQPLLLCVNSGLILGFLFLSFLPLMQSIQTL